MSEQEEKPIWRFHSPHKNEIVYCPIKKTEIAVFAEHQLITDDPELAKKLQERGYEEWVVFSEDDVFPLENGESIRLGDLPAAIRKEFIGKPKRAAQDLIGKVKGLSPFSKGTNPEETDKEPSDDDEPILENQCPICRKQYDSASALNGHFAHCKQDSEE